MPAILRITKPNTKFLRIGNGVKAVVPVPSAPTTPAERELVGKAVFFGRDGVRLAGKVASVGEKVARVKLAVPGRDGILRVSDSEVEVKLTELEPTQALTSDCQIKRFEIGASIVLPNDAKAVPIHAPGPAGEKDAGPIIDYRDVFIEGFASTFAEYTKVDRGGDYIIQGAFDQTLVEFQKNPVILTNHENTTNALAGSWTKIGVTKQGLAVRGAITNAPGMRDLRFKLVEGHLKGLSIGGIWYYGNDGRGIEQADLFEISLVAVPMNPDALCYTASLGEADCRKAFAKFWKNNASLRAN